MKRLAILLALIFAASVSAVTTSHWTHTTEGDFQAGTMHTTVATSLGDVKLSRAVKTLMEQLPDVDAVFALAEGSDKTIYAGTGPKGVLLQVKDDKVTELLRLEEGENIFSIAIDKDDTLYVGTGGEKGLIYRIEKGQKPKVIFEQEGVQYVWAVLQMPDGAIYAATGPEGQLFEIPPNGKTHVLFDCDENNLLSLTTDHQDTLYVGTDPNGLVYRINRKTGEAFVLYDAPETEITGLVLQANGNLFAATGQSADETDHGAEGGDAQQQNGRPDANNEAVMQAPAVAFPKLLINEAPDVGEKTPRAGATTKEAATPDVAAPGTATASSDVPAAEGNAIYCIEPSGTVTEVFRQTLPFVSLIESQGKLLAGTGGDGKIFQITPGSDENITLAKVDSSQVSAMLALSDGRVMLGMANAGSIASMDKGFAGEGTYISAVLDAAQISQFGKIQFHGTIPDGTSVKIATRSGNLQEPGEKTWSKWSDDAPAADFVDIKTQGARFFQYRLTLTSNDSGKTPTVEDVDVAYLLPNLAPQIKSIKLEAKTDGDAENNAAQPASQRHQTITWECTDPNNDPIEYSLYFRLAQKGEWILLKDKLKELTHEWDTRGAADGRYEIKVIASDVKANPTGSGKTTSRISDPIVVDNTAPVISDVKTVAEAGGATISCRVVDRTSTIASVAYAVDSSTDWQATQALDNIFDQPAKSAAVKVTGLSAGMHQITLRATDARGNQAFESVTVRIEGPTASK